MRSRSSKHTIQELERYIHMYLHEGWSYQELCEEEGLLLSVSSFNDRVLRYKENGITGIKTKKSNNRYSKEIKESIVQEYLERGTPLRQLARKYNIPRSEEHTSELQSRGHLVCRLLLEKKN